MAEKPQANADKLKVLSAVMDKIEKDFGCLLYTSDAADEA